MAFCAAAYDRDYEDRDGDQDVVLISPIPPPWIPFDNCDAKAPG